MSQRRLLDRHFPPRLPVRRKTLSTSKCLTSKVRRRTGAFLEKTWQQRPFRPSTQFRTSTVSSTTISGHSIERNLTSRVTQRVPTWMISSPLGRTSVTLRPSRPFSKVRPRSPSSIFDSLSQDLEFIPAEMNRILKLIGTLDEKCEGEPHSAQTYIKAVTVRCRDY